MLCYSHGCTVFPLRRICWSTVLFCSSICLWIVFTSAESQAQPLVPTSGRIAFHNYTAWDIDLGDPNGPNSLDGQIHLYDFASNTVSTIGVIDQFVRHALNPNFSPDGTKITFAGIPRGPSYGSDWFNFLDTYEYDFTKGTLINISEAAKLGSSIDEDAVYGPGGSSIIYKKDFQSLWSIDLANFQETELFPSALEIVEPKVSPSGQWITYWQLVGGDASTGDVYRRPILPNGSVGAAIPVATTPGVLEYFSSFLDDQTIVYSRWTSATSLDDEIYLVDLTTGQSSSVAFNLTGTADDSDAFRLEDTNTVGFSSTRPGGKGGYDLYIGDSTTGDVHYLQVASTAKEDLAGSFHTDFFQIQPGISLFQETFDTDITGATAFDNLYGGSQFGVSLANTSIAVATGSLQPPLDLAKRVFSRPLIFRPRWASTSRSRLGRLPAMVISMLAYPLEIPRWSFILVLAQLRERFGLVTARIKIWDSFLPTAFYIRGVSRFRLQEKFRLQLLTGSIPTMSFQPRSSTLCWPRALTWVSSEKEVPAQLPSKVCTIISSFRRAR